MAKVSIGLPVWNGAATIADTISSLLSQSLADFELIVSDNGSTDDTVRVVRGFNDPRIILHRQPMNVGGAANFRFVLSEATAEYFVWAAADDVYLPSFLADNVAVLDADREAVTSVGFVEMADECDAKRLGNFALAGEPIERIRALLTNPGDNCRACGVFRRADLAAVVVAETFVAWDWANMVGLASRGTFRSLPQTHVIRGTNGESRRPDYGSARLFLAPFTRWLWRELGPAQFLACADLVAFHNARFSAPWQAASQSLKAIGVRKPHRRLPARKPRLATGWGSRGSDTRTG